MNSDMATIVNGNANRLPLPAEYAHTIIVSPPYWGLRDYGLPSTVWGGESGCNHKWEATAEPGGSGSTESRRRDRAAGRKRGGLQPGFCLNCGAWKGCLGLEPTPELFVQHMVEVGREWWRVLRSDGTLWLNFGDTYIGGGRGGWKDSNNGLNLRLPAHSDDWVKQSKSSPNLKPKDLSGVPWQVALALRDDGWYLRSAIPWVKKNSLPESVKDRPGTSHEYLFLLSKNKSYYYDRDAIRMPPADYYRVGGSTDYAASSSTNGVSSKSLHQMAVNGRKRRSGDWYYDSVDLAIRQTENYLAHLKHVRENGGLQLHDDGSPAAMLVNTRPYKGAHFAVFPPEIVEPCIKASTSEYGVCTQCGAQWRRVTKEKLRPTKKAAKTFIIDERDMTADKNDQGSNRQKDGHKSGFITKVETTGWEPTCDCNCDEVKPAIVLDTFAGSGTTGMTAVKLRRKGVLVDLSHCYLKELATERVGNIQMALPV